MRALFYGGPLHNTIREINPNLLGEVEINRMKPRRRTAAAVARADAEYFIMPDNPIERLIYEPRKVHGEYIDPMTLVKTDSWARVYVLNRKKPYDPEKILRLAERRGFAEVIKTVLQ